MIKDNIAVEAISAAVGTYKKNPFKKLKVINVQSTWWTMFKGWMSQNAPDINFDDNGIEFKDTLIRKGHSFMKERLEFEFDITNVN